MTIKNDIREEILKELQKNKRRKNKKSYREIANLFGCDEKTIRNIEKKVKEAKNLKNIIASLYYYCDDKDKSCMKQILMSYYSVSKNSYDKALKETTIVTYCNGKNILDKNETTKEYNKIIKYLNGKEIGILFKTFFLTNDFQIDYKVNKDEAINYIINQINSLKNINSEEEIKKICEDDDYFERYYKILGFYPFFLLSFVMKSISENNLEYLSDISKRYDYYLIKDDEKDKEEVKFKRDIEIIDTLEEYWEFQKKYPLEEKQIIVILSNLVLELTNMTILEKIKDRIDKKKLDGMLDYNELRYLEYIKRYLNINNRKKDVKDKIKDIDNRNLKEKFNKEIKAIKDNGLFGYFYFSLENNETYYYKGTVFHRILYTLLHMQKNAINSNDKEIKIMYHIPTFLDEYLNKDDIQNLKGIKNPLDLELLNSKKDIREYFKEVMELKEDIPPEFNTFEKILSYINYLEFKLDGSYCIKKEKDMKDKLEILSEFNISESDYKRYSELYKILLKKRKEKK